MTPKSLKNEILSYEILKKNKNLIPLCQTFSCTDDVKLHPFGLFPIIFHGLLSVFTHLGDARVI